MFLFIAKKNVKNYLSVMSKWSFERVCVCNRGRYVDGGYAPTTCSLLYKRTTNLDNKFKAPYSNCFKNTKYPIADLRSSTHLIFFMGTYDSKSINIWSIMCISIFVS